MYYKQKIEIPKCGSKVYPLRKDKHIYVYYEIGRTYDKETQKTSPKRVSIGKLDDITDREMWPNEKYFLYFGNDEIVKKKKEMVHKMSASVKIGTMLILEKIEEEYGMAERLVGKGLCRPRAELLLDVASYMITCNTNVSQHYDRYAYEHVLFDRDNHGYSDTTIGRLFSEDLTDELMVSFINDWCGRKDKESPIYISYDSTNKNCQAGNILLAEYGHAKDDKNVPIINYSMAYDTTNSEPLFYEVYPGGINDVIQLSCMLDKASSYDFRHLRFILDRGYFSTANLKEMREKGAEYLIMFKNDRSREYFNTTINSVRSTFEEKNRNYSDAFQLFGTTLRKDYEGMEHWVHVYYSSNSRSKEMTKILRDVAETRTYLNSRLGKNFDRTEYSREYFNLETAGRVLKSFTENDEAIDEAISRCGYFMILSSYETNWREALKLYKSRDASEKVFMTDKTFLGDSTLKVESEAAVKGKTFTSFIAQILRNRMHTGIYKLALSSASKQNWMNVEAMIEEMEMITLAVGGDGCYRLYNALTTKQKDILSAFGISEKDAMNMIARAEKKVTEARRIEGEEVLRNGKNDDTGSTEQADRC